MRTRNWRSVVYLGAAFGLVTSLFATAEFFDAALRQICSAGSFFSCSLIDESGKTTTLGVPDYLWGIAGFVAILVVAALAELHSRDLRYTYALVGLTTAGVALSAYFLYVELAEIHGLCPVCLTAYLFGWLCWIGSLAILRRLRLRARKLAPAAPAASG